VVPGEVGIGGIGGRLLSLEGRDELSPIEVAYVVTLNRDGGSTYGTEGSGLNDFCKASLKLRSIVPAESFL
jgi:hypothetical protein